KKRPLAIAVEQGSKQSPQAETFTLVPDAWLTLSYQSGKRRCVALELDRGTEEQKKWRRKARAYITHYDSLFTQQYPATPLTIAVVATPSQTRCDALVRWTQAELEEMGRMNRDYHFRFKYLLPDQAASVTRMMVPRARLPPARRRR